MTRNVQLYAPLFVNLQDVIALVKNQKTLFVMLNVKNQIAKLCALIKHVKQKIALNVSLFANHHIVSLIAKLQNHLVKLFVKNLNVTGNAQNLNVQSQNVN